MNAKENLEKRLFIRTSIKEITAHEVPLDDRKYWGYHDSIMDSYLKSMNRDLSLHPYIVFEVTSTKNNKSKSFFFKNAIENKSISYIFESLIRSCSWAFYDPSREGPIKDKSYKISKDNYEKFKYIFEDSLGDFLYELIAIRIEEEKEVDYLAIAMARLPDTNTNTIKLLVLHNDDDYVLERLMKHPAASGLAAFK